MSVSVQCQNHSRHKALFRKDNLTRLACRICLEEEVTGDSEVSVVFCDDAFICELNRRYRNTNRPTDVLSFPQSAAPSDQGAHMLGDIVISLETVDRFCAGERAAMRAEVRLLFCHGLLHLLGYDHAIAEERRRMIAKQAYYLGVSEQAAWHVAPHAKRNAAKTAARTGG